MTIGEKIQELRKSKGLSQEQLSLEIGVSRQAVSKWESDKSVPDIDKIIILSEFFGVSTDYILFDTSDNPNTQEEKESTAQENIPVGNKNKKIKIILLAALAVILISVAVISIVLSASEQTPTIQNIGSNEGSTDMGETKGYGFYGNAHYYIDIGGYNASVSLSLCEEDGKIAMGESTIKAVGGKVYVTTDIGPAPNKRDRADYVECTTEVPVEEVYIDGRLVWKDGLEIIPVVYDIFNAKREEVNECFNGHNEIAYLVGITDNIPLDLSQSGIYSSGNRAIYSNNYGVNDEYLERIMREYTMSAYILLGVVGKLEAVDFRFYDENGKEKNFTITKEDADKFYGNDIKELGKDIIVLQNFVNDNVMTHGWGLLDGHFDSYYYNKFFMENPYYEDIAVCPIVETPNIKTVRVRCFFGDEYLVATKSAFLIHDLGWSSSSYGNMHIDEKTFGVSGLNDTASMSHDMAYIDFVVVDLEGNEYAFKDSRFYTRDIFKGNYTIESDENYGINDKIPSIEVSIIEKNNTYYIYDNHSKTYSPAVSLDK